LQERCSAPALLRILFQMAAAGSALEEKRQVVERFLGGAMEFVSHELATHDLSEFDCTCSRDGIMFMDLEGFPTATDDDWNRALSEGLGTKFTVEWSDPKYSAVGVRMLRRGEAIFEAMKCEGLDPEWNGTSEGGFTITAVDRVGARLALAMALHPRLGANSQLSLVSSLALILVACTSTNEM